MIALAFALIFEDNVALRAAARDGAPISARFTRGEWVEVRGTSHDYYKVWDETRQRAGYVQKWQVRVFDPKDKQSAVLLRALVAFVKDAPGMETLGLGAATLYFDLAEANAPAAEVYDAIGVMGARLARRASKRQSGPQDVALPEHLAFAERLGLRFVDAEKDGRTIVCEAGDAFRHVLSSDEAGPEAMARAALELTAATCVDPLTRPSDLVLWHRWRIDALARVDLDALVRDGLAHVAARVRLREAETLAALVFELGRVHGPLEPSLPGLAKSAERALLAVDRAALPESERRRYEETAIAVGAVAQVGAGATPALQLATKPDGSRCLTVAKRDHCTFGVPWLQGARWSPDEKTLIVPLQTQAQWTELWVIDTAGKEDVIVPWATAPLTGYVELAGFSADSQKIFVVREAVTEGQPQRRFAMIDRASLDVKAQGGAESAVTGFKRFASSQWRATTLSLR